MGRAQVQTRAERQGSFYGKKTESVCRRRLDPRRDNQA